MGFLSLHKNTGYSINRCFVYRFVKKFKQGNKEEGYIEVNITKHVACDDQTFLSLSLFKPCTKISSLSNATRMTFKGDV